MSSNRAAPARAVVLNADGVAAQRTAAFLKLLGIEREEITPETLIGWASAETGSRFGKGSCLVLSGDGLLGLLRDAAQQGVSFRSSHRVVLGASFCIALTRAVLICT